MRLSVEVRRMKVVSARCEVANGAAFVCAGSICYAFGGSQSREL